MQKNEGPNGTFRVPSGPRNLGREISESLTGRLEKVNRPVPFGPYFVIYNSRRVG